MARSKQTYRHRRSGTKRTAPASTNDSRKDGLVKFFESGEFTDFTIECGDKQINVHKVVLAAQSEHFRVLCGPRYKEGFEGKVVLKSTKDEDGDESCDDPEAVKLMVDFLYYEDYKVEAVDLAVRNTKATSSASRGGDSTDRSKQLELELEDYFGADIVIGGSWSKPHFDGNMIMHAKIFAAATKYGISALQTLSSTRFTAAVGVNRNHPTFAEAAHIVYNTTVGSVRHLRDTVCSTIHDHKSLLDAPAIESVVKFNEDLHFELLRLANGLSAVAKDENGEEDLGDEDMDCSEAEEVVLSSEGDLEDEDGEESEAEDVDLLIGGDGFEGRASSDIESL
ncbi:hypothetical protein LTR10_010746 [Elasticomyces elasticus]|nr:hypothetical protein LTR10_010746 [Elasticomyces elasticus]KAK4968352.1 hypothetical protein LTR42_009635 [Elasticomyces elasticus]